MTQALSNPPLRIPCLIVIVGHPGSGKTTWARRNGYGAIHVSQDGLIDAITPDGFEHVYRPIYQHAEESIARAALLAGHTVIVDRTNRTRAHRGQWLQLAAETGCPAVAVTMNTAEALCRQRNAQRDFGRLSEERMNRMLTAFESVSPGEGFAATYLNDGVGAGVKLGDILSQLHNKETAYEHCYETR